jgi:hypothetical protein
MLMTGAVIVCLVSAQWNGRLFASEEERIVSETQTPTSTEPAPAISIDEHAAGTGDLSPALPRIERSRFTLDAGNFTASPSPGPVAPGAHRTFNFLPAQSSAFAGQV